MIMKNNSTTMNKTMQLLEHYMRFYGSHDIPNTLDQVMLFWKKGASTIAEGTSQLSEEIPVAGIHMTIGLCFIQPNYNIQPTSRHPTLLTFNVLSISENELQGGIINPTNKMSQKEEATNRSPSK
jgi:hypothetical protein